MTETVGFNSPLTSTSKLQLLYWGDKYTKFCGQLDQFKWYPNYIELGYLHNWLNLAFFSDSYSYQVLADYRMADGSGQIVRDSVA